MKPSLIILCAVLRTAPALAQEAAQPDTQPSPVHEASVSLEDCRRIVSHAPADDVQYQPGVDVYGNPVEPADVPPEPALGEIRPPDEIVIDFGIDLAGQYGIPGTGLYTATAGILTIQYDLAMGTLTVNGKPLRAAESKAVAKACAMMLKDAAGGEGGQ